MFVVGSISVTHPQERLNQTCSPSSGLLQTGMGLSEHSPSHVFVSAHVGQQKQSKCNVHAHASVGVCVCVCPGGDSARDISQ